MLHEQSGSARRNGFRGPLHGNPITSQALRARLGRILPNSTGIPRLFVGSGVRLARLEPLAYNLPALPPRQGDEPANPRGTRKSWSRNRIFLTSILLSVDLLRGLVSVVCRYPLGVLLLSLSIVGVSLWAAATRLEYKTQRNDLVSPDKEYQQRWRIISPSSATMTTSSSSSRARIGRAWSKRWKHWPSRVAGPARLFDRLFYKVDLRSLRNRGAAVPFDRANSVDSASSGRHGAAAGSSARSHGDC